MSDISNADLLVKIEAASESLKRAPREAPPLVRVWDLNFTLLTTIENGWRLDEPETLTQPIDSPLARWMLSDLRRRRGEVFLTADHDGKRWIGRQRVLEVLKRPFGDGHVRYMKCTFQNDTDYMAEKLAKVKGVQ